MPTGEAEFSVYWWDPTGEYHKETERPLNAEDAVALACGLTQRPAARLGVITKVMITDGGDHCVFEWKVGEGVVFPPQKKEPRS